MIALVRFWIDHRLEFLGLVAQHALLVGVATAAAVLIGVPLGIVAAKRPRFGRPIVAVANVLQTIPSLAMFGFLLPLPLLGGIGTHTAILVLVLYGLLPIVRTTVAGITGIDRAVIESGLAMGMTPRQLLTMVELPLAAPSIVAGIRVATVIGVGTATIAAAIGAGGLGEYIFRGLSMVDPTVILAGAIPAAVLAIGADLTLTWVERRLAPGGKRIALPSPTVLMALALMTLTVGGVLLTRGRADTIRIGSKNFTEQLLLGELLAQAIEKDTDLAVDRRLNLGGTFICDRALEAGAIDAYVEYTGTALTAIFHRPVARSPAAVVDEVERAYAQSGRTMLPSLGFNNTFAILVRRSDAREKSLRSIADLAPVAPGWRAGFGYEFLEREDGFRGLAAAYGLRFSAPPRVMDLAIIYPALAGGQIDVTAGDATNGLIDRLELQVLEDSRGYFPPYHAVPVVRTQTLLRYPQVGAALRRLAGRIGEREMRAMNYAVDGEHRDPAAVVREFLARTAPTSAP